MLQETMLVNSLAEVKKKTGLPKWRRAAWEIFPKPILFPRS